MRKGFLTLLAGYLVFSGMAIAQVPAALPNDSELRRPRETQPLGGTPSALDECNPGCADRCPCGPAGRFWISAEYLYWWTRESRLPALATSGSAADPIPGAIGQQGTRVLFGNSADNEGRSGFRIEGGFWFNESHTCGFDVSYFSLGSRTNGFVAGATGLPGSPVITRPFIDIPANGGTPFQNSEIVAFPGTAAGVISIQNTTRLQGAAPNGLLNLCCYDDCCGGRRLDLIGGFRWMELNDSLNIIENITPGPNQGFPAGSRVAVIDQFSTQNDFYGGQIGFRGEWWRDRFFVDARALVAAGVTQQHVTINGTTIFTPAAGAPTSIPGGLLALPTNMGGYRRNVFSIVPEVGLNLGYQINPNLRIFAGYTFIYWSNVARPGDVIDTRVNRSQLPTSSGPSPLIGPARPAFQFNDSNFWAHGISAGIELRF